MSIIAPVERVAAVRAFNRFYTGRIGLLKGGLHRTAHPLPDARVLYELGAGGGAAEVADLRTALDIDAGQLSRLLTKLEAEDLVTRERLEGDGRRQRARLTTTGRTTFDTLNERSAAEIGRLLDRLGEDRQRRLVDALAEIERAMRDDTPAVVIRGLRPGDLGWMVERHGALYAAEYGWDESFERLVARIAADYDPTRDRGWIAELDGTRAGCVLLVHDSRTTAKLRTLIVEPHARGRALGRRLVETCVEQARADGYDTLTLWTVDILTAARRIYERAGFVLTREEGNHAFGRDLVDQYWSLTLRP